MEFTDIGTVKVDRKHNVSRGQDVSRWFDAADYPKLINEMSQGWSEAFPAIVMPIPADELKAAYDSHKEYVTERERIVETTGDLDCGNHVLSVADRLHALRAVYYTNGKIKKPTHDLVLAFRRTYSFFDAIALANRKHMPISYEIPVRVQAFASLLARYRLNVFENEYKNKGNRPLGNREKYLAGRSLFEVGYTESDLRTLWSSTIAQRVVRLIRADNAYPAINLHGRIENGDLEITQLSWQKIEAATNAGQSELEAYLASPENTTTKVKRAASASLESIRDNNKIKLVKELAAGDLNADFSTLQTRYNPHAELLNAVIEAIVDGRFQDAVDSILRHQALKTPTPVVIKPVAQNEPVVVA